MKPVDTGSAPPRSAPSAPAACGRARDAAPADPKVLGAAREFEAILLRKVLSSLQKTTHVGGEAAASSGGEMYGSMMVNALADAVAAAGGIGLSELVGRAMAAPGPAPSPHGAKVTGPAQVCDRSAVPPGHRKP